MRVIFFKLLFFSNLALIGCTQKEIKKDFILSERDLVPEGIAVDERTGIVYVGSTFKRKIVQIRPNNEISDFLTQEKDGIWSLVGMEVDEYNGILWANTAHAHAVMPLLHPDTSRDWMTSVIAINLDTGNIMHNYVLPEEKGFFNDLTVLPNGDVYITETYHSRIYRIDSGTDSIHLFLALDTFSFANGITYAPDLKMLFVSCSQGILKIDPITKRIQLIAVPPDTDAGFIDGLTYFKNDLIGHQSDRVSRFYLNAEGDKINHVSILDTGDEFDSSTTGEVADGYYYFIVNSQIQSGIDRLTGTIKPPDSLKQVIVRKFKL